MKKVVRILLVAVMMLSMVRIYNVKAAEIVDCGTVGDLSYTLDSNGLLTIEGEGDYDTDSLPLWCITGAKYAKVNVKGIHSIKNMFYTMESIESIDFSGSDLSNVTDMSSLFVSCINLQSVNFGNVDTSNVTNMSNMFNRCKSLKSIDLSGLNTSKVTDMSSMFYEDTNLESINFSGFNTKKVTTMEDMFALCTSLKELDLSSFDTSSLTNVTGMFEYCESLSTSITFSNKITDYEYCFDDAATDNALITVRCDGVKCTKDLAKAIIATKSTYSNVSYVEGPSNSVSLCNVLLSATSYAYSGTEKKPAVTVKMGTTTLTKDKDYTVSYSNNINVGKATVTIKGIGSYSGTKEVNYTIAPKKSEIAYVSVDTKSITVKAAATASSLGADGYQIAYKKVGDTDWNYTYSTTTSKKITGLTPGAQYYVKIRAYADVDWETYNGSYSEIATSLKVLCTDHVFEDYYEIATLTQNGCSGVKCKICDYAEIVEVAHPSKFTLSYTTTPYTGKAKNPSLTIKDASGDIITSANYTVTKDAGRIEVGTYYYTVKFKGVYSGTKKVKFVINPAQATIASLTAGANSLTVKASTTASALGGEGYEIIYRKTGTTTWTHLKNTTSSKKITGLKTGSQYQVRIRAYKVVNGTTYYGAWSTINTSAKVS